MTARASPPRAARDRTRALAFGAAALLAAVLAAGAFRPPAKLDVIRVGSTAPGHAKFVLNQTRGWLDRELAKDGIRVEYLPFTGGGSEATTALASGSLDFAYTGSSPALRVAAARADVRLVGISSFNRLVSTAIVVRGDSPIRSVRDLVGKKVAYLAGTMRHAALAKALRTEGLSVSDVETVNLKFEASGPALTRGDVDALVESETTVRPLVDQGLARILVDGRDHPEWASPSVLSVNGELARRHPDLVRRFLAVDLETARWADAHFDEAIAIQAAATGVGEQALRGAHPEKLFYLDPVVSDDALASLRAEEAFMRETGLLAGSVDYATWVDTRFVDAARAALARQ